MPARLAPGGFTAASPRRHPVSRRFILLFHGFMPDIEDVPFLRGMHFPDFSAIHLLV